MLIRGDARFLPLVDGCVDCCVTSPPYWGLRDYGHGDQIGMERRWSDYVASIVVVFEELRRVLRASGTVWLNLGDCYSSSGGLTNAHGVTAQCGNTLAGLVPRDQSGPRNMTDIAAKNLIGIPWRVAFALQSSGWFLRSDVIWSKPNPMPESVQDRPTRAHEYVFMFTKSPRYWYDGAAIREPYAPSTLTQFETPYKGSSWKDYAAAGVQTPGDIKRRITDKQRGHGRRHAGFNDRWDAMPKDEQQQQGANKRSVWTVATMPYAGAHFATMPEKLVEPCILAGCPMGGLVLDPFVGSGTVIAVANRLGRRGVGVDLSYQDLARERTAQRGLSFGDAVNA